MFNQQLEWKPWPRMYSSFTLVCCTNAYCSPVSLVLCYEMTNHLFLAFVKDNLLYQTSEKHVDACNVSPAAPKCQTVTLFQFLHDYKTCFVLFFYVLVKYWTIHVLTHIHDLWSLQNNSKCQTKKIDMKWNVDFVKHSTYTTYPVVRLPIKPAALASTLLQT